MAVVSLGRVQATQGSPKAKVSRFSQAAYRGSGESTGLHGVCTCPTKGPSRPVVTDTQADGRETELGGWGSIGEGRRAECVNALLFEP